MLFFETRQKITFCTSILKQNWNQHKFYFLINLWNDQVPICKCINIHVMKVEDKCCSINQTRWERPNMMRARLIYVAQTRKALQFISSPSLAGAPKLWSSDHASMRDPHCEVMLSGRTMGWLRLVGSSKIQVSNAKEPKKRDYILQKRPIILRSLLIVATS
jgi:hypothetical protein